MVLELPKLFIKILILKSFHFTFYGIALPLTAIVFLKIPISIAQLEQRLSFEDEEYD